MSYPAFVWNNPATIGWTIVDASGNPVLGATVNATLYAGRSLETPDLTPGTPVAAMSNLVLGELGGGLYSVDLLASAIPAVGTDYVLVIDARIGTNLVRHWEEETAVSAVSGASPVRKDLCSLGDVKQSLGIPDTDTSRDANLSRLITSCSISFLVQIKRPNFYKVDTYSERIVVDNWRAEDRLDDIFVRNWPIRSVASLSLDEFVLPVYDPINTPDILGWFLDLDVPDEERQRISLRGGYMPIFHTWFSPRRSIYRPAPLRIQLTYEGGYDTPPSDVSQAIVEWVSYKIGYAKLQTADPTSQSLYLGSYRQDTMVGNTMLKAMAIGIPESVQNVIDQYARPTVG